MPGEFELIERYFKPLDRSSPAVILGMGDDAAILAPHQNLVIAMDTLVAGTHFMQDDPPETLGHKVLAVNLSDLAAMGAKPTTYLLSLTLPSAEEAWLAAFSQGLKALAAQYDMSLIGGDTTSGPLSLTITAMGEVDPQHCLRRDVAVVGDDIYVTGSLGAAALYMHAHQQGMVLTTADALVCQKAYRCPQPRVELGIALAPLAQACIDISDGLASDLGHILKASQVGATLDVGAIPLSSAMSALPRDLAQQLALSGGDDYELCFTASVNVRAEIAALARQYDLAITRIGAVTEHSGILTLTRDNMNLDWRQHGWEHF